MKDGPNISRIAALIGDHARAEVLTALMANRALTATFSAEGEREFLTHFFAASKIETATS